MHMTCMYGVNGKVQTLHYVTTDYALDLDRPVTRPNAHDMYGVNGKIKTLHHVTTDYALDLDRST